MTIIPFTTVWDNAQIWNSFEGLNFLESLSVIFENLLPWVSDDFERHDSQEKLINSTNHLKFTEFVDILAKSDKFRHIHLIDQDFDKKKDFHFFRRTLTFFRPASWEARFGFILIVIGSAFLYSFNQQYKHTFERFKDSVPGICVAVQATYLK